MKNRLVSSDAIGEWRDHWPVVCVAMLGFATAQIHLYSMGAMIVPLERDLGWSRVQISSGLLILSFIVTPLAPFMGMAVDRFGPRRIALSGILLYCTALACLSLAQQAAWTWWLLWVFLAFGHLSLNPTVWVAAVSSLFSASRGLALAVSMCATGISALISPLLTYLFVENFGWRMAYVLWAGIAATIALPAVYFFFTSAHDKDRADRKSGNTKVPKAEGMKSPPPSGAIKSFVFLKLACAALFLSIATMSMSVNLIPILMSLRIEPETAAGIAAAIGVSQILGRLGGGFLLDRFDARIVGAAVVILPVVTALVLVTSGGSVGIAIVAVLIFGLAIGAEMDVVAYLTARFFDIRMFGTIFGIIVGLLTLGNGLGPVLANWVYDLTGSYKLVLWGVMPLATASSLLLLSLGPYPANRRQGNLNGGSYASASGISH